MSAPAVAITPRGSVGFRSSGQGSFSGNCGLSEVTRGEATCSIGYTPEVPGSHQITAGFAGRLGDENTPALEPSEESSGIEAVIVPRTQTRLQCRPPSGGRTICTATVEDSPRTANAPSGEVELTTNGQGFFGRRETLFSDRARCTLVPVGQSGEAGCEVAYTPTGTAPNPHQLTAGYSGADGHQPSTDSTQFVVTLLMDVSCAPSHLAAVQLPSRCTVTVEDTTPAPRRPTGEVDLVSNGQGEFSNVCSLTRVSERVATCALDYTPTLVGDGLHEITATYLGDALHPPSFVATGIAVGTTRYAAPGGRGSDPCANPEDPCTLFKAASVEAPGTTLASGAEVVLAPGTYSSGDLGPSNQLLIGEGVRVHGVFGGPRPAISLLANGGGGRVVRVGPGSVLSHLEINGTSERPLLIDGGTVEGVIVRSSSEFSGMVVCAPVGNAEALLRDTACISSAPGATAIGATATGTTTNTVKLRNVTAIATGSESFGLRFRALGRDGQKPTLRVNAIGVIAQGDRRDVVAEGLSDTRIPGTGAEASVELANSNYTTVANVTDAGEGSANVTIPGSGSNIRTRPILAADLVHQLEGSVTINRGATDNLSGSADVDGQRRAIGPSADVGADEFVGSSEATTSLSCVPAILQLRSPTVCTAVVSAEPGSQTTPTGIISFAGDSEGAFSPGPSCQLGGTGTTASCTATYTPEAVGRHRLTASYSGDDLYGDSKAAFELTVGPGGGEKFGTATTLDCAPGAVQPGVDTVCSVTVRGVDPDDAAVPTGKVSFETDGNGAFAGGEECELGEITPIRAGCTIRYRPALPAGTHRLRATYGASEVHAGSSEAFELSVGDGVRNLTTTELNCVPGDVRAEQPTTCTATVKDTLGATAPTGKVAFEPDSLGEFAPRDCDLEPLPAPIADSASCRVEYTPTVVQSGVHELTARYGSDATHASSSGTFELGVTEEDAGGGAKRTTTVALNCVPDAVIIGGGSVCTAVVEDTDPADPSAPTGEVSFKSDSLGAFSSAGSCTIFAQGQPGQSRCQIIYEPREVGSGTHLVTATYEGDAAHSTAEAADEVSVSQPDGGHETQTALACGPASPTFGSSLFCTVEVRDSTPSGDVPNGVVALASNNAGVLRNDACTLFPVAGNARCQFVYTPLTAGAHELLALYGGDADHEPSQGSARLDVAPPNGGHSTTTTLACQPTPVVLGDAAICAATVTDDDSSPVAPTRAVIFASDSPGTFDLGGCRLERLGDDKARCSFTYRPSQLGGGIHRIAAAYEGDPGHEPSSPTFFLVTVTAPVATPASQPPSQQPRVTPAAPNTVLRKKPRKKTAKRKAMFKFVADQPGSTFQCKLDRKPFKPCRSPWKKKVKPGRHTFKVRAVNPQGIADPTPATFKWKVGKAKRR